MPNMLPQDINHKRLLILTFILFICYLYVGISLSVTPLFVAHTLKLNNVWAGLSVGSAFLVTILTRGLAGSFSDQQGAKLSVSRGLCLYLLGATFSFCSGLVTNDPWLAYTILIVGRIVLGIGESFVMVGIIGWCIGFVGPERSGKAMALVGVAMYGALAIGGPLGIYLFNHVQFSGAMLISLILPSLGLMAIWPIPPVPAHPDLKRPSFFTIITQIWPYGTIVCLQGIGFAVIGAFFSLYFHANHWPHSGLGLTFFGVGFVLVRMLCGNLPDRIGGLSVTIGSLLIEALGQTLIWDASNPYIALAGTFFTGLGCSMVFPGMGREVVRIVAPHLRGTALGGFSAFQDLAYGFTGPVAGLVADILGYKTIFLLGAATSIIGFGLAVILRFNKHKHPA